MVLSVVGMAWWPTTAMAVEGYDELKLLPDDGAGSQQFGEAVAVDGDRIVVGHSFDDANGVQSGSAYVFDTSGNQLVKLLADDGAAVDLFGRAVAIDGDRIVVGAPYDDDYGSFSGSAYVFDASGNQLAKLLPDDGAVADQFGTAVAIDGDRIVIGAYGDDDAGRDSGSAYVFDVSGNQLAKLVPEDDAAQEHLGTSVGVDGDRVAVGGFGAFDGTQSGSAYVFDTSGNQLAKLVPDGVAAGDLLGVSVAIGGDRVVVGAVSNDGDGSFSGSVYAFDTSGNQVATLVPDDGVQIGGGALAVDGDRVVVGAIGDDVNGSLSGSAYVFDTSGNQVAKLIPSDGATRDYFGDAVAIDGDRVVIGAPRDDDNGERSGSVYVFSPSDVTAPVVSVGVDPASPDGTNGWYVTAPVVSVSATDDDSGVASCEVRFDDGAWSVYSGPVSVGDGSTEVEARCSDEAGNVSDPVAVSLPVDTVAPVVAFAGNEGTYGAGDTITIVCTASDVTSGIASDSCDQASLDGAPAYDFVGDNTLTADAVDVAGNASSTSTTFTVFVDAAEIGEVVEDFVDDPKVAADLSRKAADVESAPNDRARAGKCRALHNKIRAQVGKTLTVDEAGVLHALVDEIC